MDEEESEEENVQVNGFIYSNRSRTTTRKFYNSTEAPLRISLIARGDRGNIYEGGLFRLSLGAIGMIVCDPYDQSNPGVNATVSR